jgi:hypothetical protein
LNSARHFLSQALSSPVAILSVIGSHARQEPERILQDKRHDIKTAKVTYWAFQSEAAPPPLVQQVAAENAGAPVLLLSPKSPSRRKPTSTDRAWEFSADGTAWTTFADEIGKVTGRLNPWGMALVLDRLEKAPPNSTLNLSDYEDFVRQDHPVRIALGASTICVRRKSTSATGMTRLVVAIGWLKEPYAV